MDGQQFTAYGTEGVLRVPTKAVRSERANALSSSNKYSTNWPAPEQSLDCPDYQPASRRWKKRYGEKPAVKSLGDYILTRHSAGRLCIISLNVFLYENVNIENRTDYQFVLCFL